MSATRDSRLGRWWRRLAVACALPLACVVAVHLHIAASVAARLVAAAQVQPCDALIVPGARIYENGEPYDVLRDRLDAALALWRSGAAPRIVLSGRGGGGLALDEVAAMQRYLEAQGVPTAALVLDPLGLRTLDTMDRAAKVYGVRTVIVVTNEFHLPRAVFLAQHCGLSAMGVAAPERVPLAPATRLRNAVREPLARVAAWLDVFVLGTRGQGCG